MIGLKTSRSFLIQSEISKTNTFWPRSIYQYSNMESRFSGQRSIFGVVFFVSKCLLRIEGQKKIKKILIFTWKPRDHVRIFIYRVWPIWPSHSVHTPFPVSSELAYTCCEGVAIVASWLVRPSPGLAVRVQVLVAGECCVLYLDKDTYPSSTYLHPGIQVATGKFNIGSNPAMD